MEEAMVTGRMAKEKKDRGNAVLAQDGMNASRAINLMYERLIEEQSSKFLQEEPDRPSKANWSRAASVVDSMMVAHASRFDGMSRADIKADRLRARGLL